MWTPHVPKDKGISYGVNTLLGNQTSQIMRLSHFIATNYYAIICFVSCQIPNQTQHNLVSLFCYIPLSSQQLRCVNGIHNTGTYLRLVGSHSHLLSAVIMAQTINWYLTQTTADTVWQISSRSSTTSTIFKYRVHLTIYFVPT